MESHISASTKQLLDHAEKHCDERGTRLTEKRRQVLNGLLVSRKALSAYELADFCRDELGHNLPAMSVYRILEFLEGEDLVHRLNLAKKYVACSHIACEHEHHIPQFLICKSCHQVEEISIDRSVIDSLQHSVESAGFHLASPQLELDCYCDSCD